MPHKITVTPVPNEEPNIRLYVLALIALARQQIEEDETGATTSTNMPLPLETEEGDDDVA